MLFKIKKLKNIVNINGVLVPMYLNQIKNFKTNRFFLLYGKKNRIRGNHAHKKCTQIFVPLSGSAQLEIIKEKKRKIILSSKNKKMLIIPPLHWCKINFLERNSSLLVICNVKFLEREYIRNFKDFLKLIK
jgi:dTDP-4-dehydrorhamnose 3,5-epimerase-like enzyme